MRRFYQLPRRRQWIWAMVLLLAAFLPIPAIGAWWGRYVLATGLGAIWLVAGPVIAFAGWMLLAPLWAPVMQFVTTPLFYLIGYYRYYSPLLLVEAPSGEQFRLHGGSVFDYFVHFRWRDRGRSAARKTLLWYLEGLIAIAGEVERGHLPGTVRIIAASYFFTPGTARRLGFRSGKPPRAVLLGVYANYLNILAKLSFARGRLTFPDLRQISEAETTGRELVENRPLLEDLLRTLNRSSGAERPSRRPPLELAAKSGARVG